MTLPNVLPSTHFAIVFDKMFANRRPESPDQRSDSWRLVGVKQVSSSFTVQCNRPCPAVTKFNLKFKSTGIGHVSGLSSAGHVLRNEIHGQILITGICSLSVCMLHALMTYDVDMLRNRLDSILMDRGGKCGCL